MDEIKTIEAFLSTTLLSLIPLEIAKAEKRLTLKISFTSSCEVYFSGLIFCIPAEWTKPENLPCLEEAFLIHSESSLISFDKSFCSKKKFSGNSDNRPFIFLDGCR